MPFTPEEEAEFEREKWKYESVPEKINVKKYLVVIGLILVVGIGAVAFLSMNKAGAVPKGKVVDYENITGHKGRISVSDASYVAGVMTVKTLFDLAFTDEQWGQIYQTDAPGSAMADARLAGAVRGLLDGHAYLEDANGIKREPMSIKVNANSELQYASVEFGFLADSKEQFTFNVESRSSNVDTIKTDIIRFSLK